MKRSTQELLRLCLKKDPAAWEEFVSRFSHLIYWAIERSLARCHFSFHPEELEDAFQQLFSYLWEKGLKGAQGIERLDGWLSIVSYKITLNDLRKKRRVTQKVTSLEELLPTTQEDPIKAIFASLTQKEICILRLNLLEEKTHSEISELLKIPIDMISSLIQRTKEKVAFALKRRLEGR